MGTKYATVAVSGYNSSPPVDDGTQTDANKVKWSTIKGKLADPLNTFASSVNSTILTALDQSCRQITTNDTTTTADHDKTIEIASTVTNSITVSLGDAASMAAGYVVRIANRSTTVTHNVNTVTSSNTINGTTTATVPLFPLSAITFVIDAGGAGYTIVARAYGSEGLIPQNSQSTAYTTTLADGGKHILHPTADNNARTFTIDSNANVPYPIGTAITFVNQINTVTIAITSDTMTLMGAGSTGSRTLAANGIATALKVSSTGWVISGTNLT